MSGSVCIITARGGSKRIPRKNIRAFCGSPIISYAIRAAFESGVFDEVMVSTDDDEIAQIARTYGASIPFRRSGRTSDDYATTTDVLVEVLKEYEKRGKFFDSVCCLYPTAPLVDSADLRRASELFEASGMDMLQPVAKFDFPPQRGFVLDENGMGYWMPEYADSRSQDLPDIYHDAGQFYFYRRNAIENPSRTRYPMVLERMHVQDIDDMEDWLLAEAKYRILQEMK